VNSDFFVSADTKRSDGVSCLLSKTSCCEYLAVDGSLTAQLFQDLGGSGQSIATLSNRDVEDEFLDFDVPHGICGLFVARGF
jgi:hypothetical protein